MRKDVAYLLIGAAMCFATGLTLCILRVCAGDTLPSILFTGGVGCLTAIAGIARGAHPEVTATADPAKAEIRAE